MTPELAQPRREKLREFLHASKVLSTVALGLHRAGLTGAASSTTALAIRLGNEALVLIAAERADSLGFPRPEPQLSEQLELPFAD